jgi:hypothetical protein
MQNMNNFRSVEFWKSAIMTLPDNAFFELMRTVFGKIKTPFNKQVLIGDLEKFLLRSDIRENIAGYIDQNDARIITAVAALNEPSPRELENFFTDEFSYAELHDLIVNLEERFILYRFSQESKNQEPGAIANRLALNPVLKSILSPLTGDRHLLFPPVPQSEIDTAAKAGIHVFDDRILAALLSFVFQNKTFFKYGGGGIQRKVINMAKNLFPNLQETALSLETIIGSMIVLGLFFVKDETLIIDYYRFTLFGKLSRRERLEYCAAGILCSKEGETSGTFSPWLFRSRIRNYAELINRLYDSLDQECLYPYTTLRKLAYILERNNRENEGGRIINAMEKTGLLVPVSDKHWRKVLINENKTSGKDAVIVADTPSTFLMYPEIAYNDAIELAAVSRVMEAGSTVRFELNRDSVISAFNRGMSADAIIELLLRLSNNRIDENLIFSLRDWEKRHGEVALRKALVLTLAPEQRHLVQTKSLAKLITETLAPGIYVLPEGAEEKAADVLRRAGVAIIARQDENTASATGESPSDSLRNFFPPIHTAASPVDEITHTHRANLSERATSALTEVFHTILKKMHLGREEHDELTARIDRRLVLCESQLKGAVIRYEKLEARGLDYAGKTMIAKQAISMQSPVEVIWPGKQKQEHIFGIPKALEKSDNENILSVEPLNGGDTIRISLGKISLLRRIKKSIFEGAE